MSKKYKVFQRSFQDMERAVPKEEVIIVLDNLDFSWYPSEIELAKELWKQKKNIFEMAEELRPENHITGIQETFLLLFHLLEAGQISKRKGIDKFYCLGE